MKKTLRHLVVAVLLANATVLTYETHAAGALGVVFDPTNWLQNIISADSSIQQVIIANQQYIQQAMQVANSAQQVKQMIEDAKRAKSSLKGMSTAEIFNLAKNTNPELGVYSDLNNRLNSASGNLRKLSDLYRGAETYGNYMNWTPAQLLDNEKQRRHLSMSTDRSFLTNIQKTMESVNNDIHKINTIRGQIADNQSDPDATQSLRKALETSAVQLNMIAGQNTQLLAIMGEDIYSRRVQKIGDSAMSDQSENAAKLRREAEFARAEQYRAESRNRVNSHWGK